ncbi:hypothetical protein RIF29_41316 [Crotalaria pallida]|uniref:Uncharacterized protein n=1 Tax=Crotalaria pallida TaxID=3830 RepID=A0AAN9E4S1_CROPI
MAPKTNKGKNIAADQGGEGRRRREYVTNSVRRKRIEDRQAGSSSQVAPPPPPPAPVGHESQQELIQQQEAVQEEAAHEEAVHEEGEKQVEVTPDYQDTSLLTTYNEHQAKQIWQGYDRLLSRIGYSSTSR